jgi:adenylylsulfate kinase-like enzyme
MNSKIVLLSGTAESGKTTVANMLKERLEEDGKKCLIINFSDYLKFIAKAYFGWDGGKR